MSEAGAGRWVPGLIHLHSTYSDGHNSIGQLKRWAKERRYQFMIVTDHADMMGKRWREYVAECQAETEAGFVVIPGLEISTGWALPEGQDESTAHTLALDISEALDAFTPPGSGLLTDLDPTAARKIRAHQVQSILGERQVPLSAAHQFQYAKLKASLSEPLAGSDFRYDMAAVAASPGIDFYYRTILELDHEPEDLALYTGLVNRWLARENGQLSRDLPWAYTGSDYHAGWMGIGRFGWMVPLAREQLSHATWIHLQGELSAEGILSAVKRRHTCATRGRTNIVQVNDVQPTPGLPDAQPPAWRPDSKITVDVTFPRETTRPMYVHVYRDGVEVSGFMNTYDRGTERLIVKWKLPAPEKPLHAYVVVISGKLVTSPILIAGE